MYRCKTGAAWVWVRQVLASKQEELQEIRENKASSLWASLREGRGGDLRKDSWQDGSQNKAERAVWYQHFSASVWRNPAGRSEVISPGSMWNHHWNHRTSQPGKPQKHCGKPGAFWCNLFPRMESSRHVLSSNLLQFDGAHLKHFRGFLKGYICST